MIRETYYNFNRSFQWIDICNPSAEELQSLAQEFDIHKTSVQDCLEPYHLPKYERLEKHRFLIVRVIEEKCDYNVPTILELTRKIAIFTGQGFLLTIHRREVAYLSLMKSKWAGRLKTYEGDPRDHLLLDLLSEGFQTFDQELDSDGVTLEDLELAVFDLKPKAYDLHALYRLKRRTSICKRLLRLSAEVVTKLAVDIDEKSQIYVRDLKEDLENSIFFADDLQESLNQLLATHHSIESHRANEVMKVLAIFSAFFFPLTLIAGIYGMNFKFMPELEWAHGYTFSLVMMALTSLGVYLWFKKKKWL